MGYSTPKKPFDMSDFLSGTSRPQRPRFGRRYAAKPGVGSTVDETQQDDAEQEEAAQADLGVSKAD